MLQLQYLQACSNIGSTLRPVVPSVMQLPGLAYYLQRRQHFEARVGALCLAGVPLQVPVIQCHLGPRRGHQRLIQPKSLKLISSI
jgi:hypothetical protein